LEKILKKINIIFRERRLSENDKMFLMAGVNFLANLCWSGNSLPNQNAMLDRTGGRIIDLNDFSRLYYRDAENKKLDTDDNHVWGIRCHAIAHIHALTKHSDPWIYKRAKEAIQEHKRVERSDHVIHFIDDLTRLPEDVSTQKTGVSTGNKQQSSLGELVDEPPENKYLHLYRSSFPDTSPYHPEPEVTNRDLQAQLNVLQQQVPE